MPGARRSLLVVLISLQVLLWSLNYLAGKLALRAFDPFTLAAYRLVLAGLLYVPLLAMRNARHLFRLRDLPVLALLGLLGVVLNQGGFVVSLEYTSVGHVALMVAIGPLLVLLLARLAGLETLAPVRVTGLSLSFLGAALLVLSALRHGEAAALRGDLIAFCSTAGFAIFTVLGKKTAHRYDPITATAVAHITGAVVMLPLAIVRWPQTPWHRVPAQAWFGLFYMAVFGSVAGYLIFYRLLQSLAASQLAALNYLLPIGATLLGVLFLGERLSPRFLAAAGLILCGVWLAERGAVAERWQTAPAD
jgi:drug/metabolite transporter (DMT)-like permease